MADGEKHTGRSSLNLAYRGPGQPGDLSGFETDAQLRGLGIGTYLLQVVKSVSTQLSIPTITGRVLPHESRAGDLYLKHGAQHVCGTCSVASGTQHCAHPGSNVGAFHFHF